METINFIYKERVLNNFKLLRNYCIKLKKCTNYNFIKIYKIGNV